jgi:tetratricopeptide (TPR) repeat protein
MSGRMTCRFCAERLGSSTSAKRMGTKRFSMAIITAILLNAGAVLAANQYDRDCSKTSDPGGGNASCTSVIKGGFEITQKGLFAVHARGSVYYPEGDRDRAISAIETIRFDSQGLNDAQDHRTKDQAKSDLSRIIGYYNAAIKRDPEDDDAYFHRGIANFYEGFLPLALADLSQASKLDPEYAYYALWLDILNKRGKVASRLPQAIAHINMTKWPAPVIRLFLGQTTPVAVLAAADDPDADIKKSQICEANFYMGELALQQDVKEESARLFRLAAADCPRDFVEGAAAYAELKALGMGP